MRRATQIDTSGWPVQVPVGYRAGEWTVRAPIATGAWGSVYEARDTAHAKAALKFLPTGTLTPRQLAYLGDMVRRERSLHAELAHPRVIRLLETLSLDDPDHPELDGSCVLVMELAAGSLSERLAQKPAPLAEGPRIIAEICEGLAHLHGSGRVHGDLKPSNILLMPDDSVRLADFGLTTELELESTHAYLAPLGSPDYVPPERWTEPLTERGFAIRPTADIWALGVIAHQLLVGGLPFPGGTIRARQAAAAAYADGRAELTLPGSAELPSGWRAFIADCLAPDHRRRAGWDAAALLRRARKLIDDPEARVTAPAVRRRRVRSLALAAGAALLAAGGVIGGVLAASGPPPAPNSDYSRWFNTASDIPHAYYPLILQSGTACAKPGVSPALVAAILKAQSDWNPNLADPAKDEYGIARWTPRVLWYYLPQEQSAIPRPPFPPNLSIPAVGRFLCNFSSALQGVPGDRGLLLAAVFESSEERVLTNRGVPPELRDYEHRVESALLNYLPQGSPHPVLPASGTIPPSGKPS